MEKDKIFVTKTFLPSFDDYVDRIKVLWENRWLTNRGDFVIDLEKKLKQFLNINNVLFVNNGMSALQIAIKALDLKGEIITTPFSYVATTGAILWEGCQPIFVDIEDKTFCIDPYKIEAAITSNTSAILATHVFGHHCDIERIQKVADKYNLRVIYDAAHAFNVNYKGKSIFNFGDISICSFHATKLFHTVEGGAIICNLPELEKRIKLLHQFGHLYEEYSDIGINAKSSELHAAMGIALFPFIDDIIAKRKDRYLYYKEKLNGLSIQYPEPITMEGYNYAYFPVVFESETILLDVTNKLESSEIYARRYFYPSLNNLPYVVYQACPISEDISSRILCLPFYPELEYSTIDIICQTIKNELNAN